MSGGIAAVVSGINERGFSTMGRVSHGSGCPRNRIAAPVSESGPNHHEDSTLSAVIHWKSNP